MEQSNILMWKPGQLLTWKNHDVRLFSKNATFAIVLSVTPYTHEHRHWADIYAELCRDQFGAKIMYDDGEILDIIYGGFDGYNFFWVVC